MRPVCRIAVLVGLVLPLPALADTYTFSYTGNDFTAIQNEATSGLAYTTSDFVTATITVSLSAPLTNTDLLSITPTTFTISDGVQTFTQATPVAGATVFQFSTDATGSITGWIVFVGGGNVAIQTAKTSNTTQDLAYNTNADTFTTDQAHVNNDPGTWTITDDTPQAATPEPSSLALLATGLSGLGVFLRRRVS